MKSLILFLLPSFLFISNIEKNGNDSEKCDFCILKIDVSNTTSDYGPWSTANCYSGIIYRTKCNSSYCTIQFQSIYKNENCVSFSWEIWEDYNMTKAISTGNRVYCMGYQDTKEFDYVPKNKNAGVWIVVKKLRFIKNDTGKYEPCDH